MKIAEMNSGYYKLRNVKDGYGKPYTDEEKLQENRNEISNLIKILEDYYDKMFENQGE